MASLVGPSLFSITLNRHTRSRLSAGAGTVRNEDRLHERRSQDGGRREAANRSATGGRATSVSEFEGLTGISTPSE
jgi:hypothetical protein